MRGPSPWSTLFPYTTLFRSLVVLPQVRVGLIAVAVFAFIRAWEEYIFVRTFLIENTNWVMSLYLFWVADDVMGVRSEEHTSELQSHHDLVCRLLLEKKYRSH